MPDPVQPPPGGSPPPQIEIDPKFAKAIDPAAPIPIRMMAARRWQAVYESAEIGGARAIVFTREVVDGGAMVVSDTDRRLAAPINVAPTN